MGACTCAQKKTKQYEEFGSPVIFSQDDKDLVKRFSAAQIDILKKEFQRYTKGSNYLTRVQFGLMFPQFENFPEVANHAYEKVFNETQGKGISYQTFCIALARLIVASRDIRIETLHMIFDLDDDGELNLSEVMQLL